MLNLLALPQRPIYRLPADRPRPHAARKIDLASVKQQDERQEERVAGLRGITPAAYNYR